YPTRHLTAALPGHWFPARAPASDRRDGEWLRRGHTSQNLQLGLPAQDCNTGRILPQWMANPPLLRPDFSVDANPASLFVASWSRRHLHHRRKNPETGAEQR